MYSHKKETAKTSSFRLGISLLALISMMSAGNAKAESRPSDDKNAQANKANDTQGDSQTRLGTDSDDNGSQESPITSNTVITLRNQIGRALQAHTSYVKELQAGSRRAVKPFPPLQLAVAPTSIAFGIVNLGSSSAQTLTLSNSGIESLNVTQIGVWGAGYSIAGTVFPISLNPGGKATINVLFAPTTVGKATGQLAISSDATNSLVTVEMTAAGTNTGNAPVIITEPVNKTVSVGQSATFSVSNIGTPPMTYQWQKNGSPISGAISSTYTTPPTTPPDNGSQFAVEVSNSDGSAVSSSAVLTVTSTYILNDTSSSLNLGSVNISSSSQQTVTFTNSGTGNVTISNVSVSGSGFNANGLSIGTILAGGQSATLTATFAPAIEGIATGSITVTSNASNGTKVVALYGTGTTPTYSATLTWSPSTSTVLGYNVYVSTVSGGSYVKLTPSPISVISYTDGGLQPAQTRYYVVTAVDSNNDESAFSNQVSAIIP